MKQSTLTFAGGVGSVTGANFLLDTGGARIAIDCGLVQGDKFADEINRRPFSYDPASVDILLITHAHADHIGRIPKFVKDGFRGVIMSTPATKELSAVMLPDAQRILAEEARRDSLAPLYDPEDITLALSLWKTFEYRTKTELKDGVTLFAKDAGHILGSAILELSREGRTIAFTGDLGNSPSLLLPDTETPSADYVLIESVYGDRNHESKTERDNKFLEVLRDTAKHGRTLIIPAFSIERTQMLLYKLNGYVESGELDAMPIFIDSPLAIKVTEIYKRYTDDFKREVRDEISAGDDIFEFPRLVFTPEPEDAKEIERTPAPKVIMAGSGMSGGGRVLKHEKHYLSSPKTTLLLVGYQSAGTIGRQLLDGARKIRIDGSEVKVAAKIESIMGFSSHKDSDNLVAFVESAGERLKKVFVAMGELKSSSFLAQRIRDNLGVDAVVPEEGQEEVISF